MTDAAAAGDRQCSAKGCRAAARTALLWNNPRVHAPSRRKVWLACAEHEESLGAFLAVRGFLKDRVSAAQIPADAG